MEVQRKISDDALAVMSWRARPDMSCEYVSQAWQDFTGSSAAQAFGDGWSRRLHPEDLPRWLEAAVRAFDERAPFEIEYRLRRRDGEYRWVLDRAAPRHADGVFVGFAGLCTDIHEHKCAQDALARALERERRLREQAENASRSRHAVTVSLLEELHAPSQAVATWAAHLRSQVPHPSESSRALDAIERNAKTQTRIIGNLLELTDPRAGARVPANEPLLAGVSVLVVESDAKTRDALASVLRVAGAEIRVVASNAEAVEAMRGWHPDVLLSRERPAEPGAFVHAQFAKPVEPVALLATVARLVQPAGL